MYLELWKFSVQNLSKCKAAMKKIFYPVIMFWGALTGCKTEVKRPETTTNNMPIPTIYTASPSIKLINGLPLDWSKFKGKKLLIVNTASECGYTPQYAELQKLYELHGDKLEIVGVPANNFGGQEPGGNNEIQTFCERNYGIKFTLTEKIKVVGDEQHPLYQWLTSPAANGWNESSPNWNFCKYLLNEKGELIHFFNSSVSPLDDSILEKL